MNENTSRSFKNAAKVAAVSSVRARKTSRQPRGFQDEEGGAAHVAPSSPVDDAGPGGHEWTPEENYREFKEEPMTIRDGPQPLPTHPLAIKAAVLAEREACARLLDEKAANLRESASDKTIGTLRQLDLAAQVMSDAADMIRGRKP